MAILNPTGMVEPGWLGQMFHDPINNLFYQARGLSPDDWRLVPRADFVGSFVKLYDFFVGLPENDPGSDYAERKQLVDDAEAVKATMAMNGVAILGFGALRWTTAACVDVMYVRLRFDRVTGLRMLFGYADAPKPWMFPNGIGFGLMADTICFGEHGSGIRAGSVVSLRMERTHRTLTGFIDDAEFGRIDVSELPPDPILALFDAADGRRPVAPGYDKALERRMAVTE